MSHVGANWRVPKRDLAGAVQVLLQHQRLRFAAALPFTPVLTQELLNFRVKIDPATAHDSYSAWREKDHDDLVLALALAAWWGERLAGDRVPAVDLSRALQRTRTPRRWGDAMASTRPRLPGRNLAGRGGPVGWLPRALGRPGALATVALDSDSYRNVHITYT